jgi:DNA-binding CsgD family transcriptional regulator
MNLEYYLKKFNDLISDQEIDVDPLDYSQFESHIALLKQLAIVENSSMSIFDLQKKQYVFAQSKFLSLLGIELKEMLEKGPQMFYSIMHPDDVPFLVETNYLFMDFIIKLESSQRKNFKLFCDFRLKDKSGVYRRFINQMLPLELDRKGNVWLMLILYDLLPSKGELFPSQRKIINICSGELYFFPQDSKDDNKNNLTRREIEILGLLAKGMISKKIADELFLSVNTVNNHRRNILEKTQSENTAMAIRYGISLGLL